MRRQAIQSSLPRHLLAHAAASLLICLSVSVLSAADSPPGDGNLSQEVIARSLVSSGDLSRLREVIQKAERGEPITLGFIGGSITEGAKATIPEHRYVNLTARWWKETFPKANITVVNAGIGATNSIYASLRATRDLLSLQPDLVFVDFAVNDKASPELAESYEGLIRQILVSPKKPAVVLLFMTRNDGVNAQEWQAKIGNLYHLPMISYHDALWPEVQSGRLPWSQIGADYIHPNDTGHAYLAKFIAELVTKARTGDAPTASDASASPALPEPLISDAFQGTVLFEAADLKPLRNEGWHYDAEKKAWVGTEPGSVIEFEVPGRKIFVMDYHLNAPMGRARVQVDDGKPVVREAWFEKTWGGYRDTVTLASGLSEGPHRVKFEILEEKNPNSEGHEFRILGLGGAGLPLSNTSEKP